jgi:hypothetical protein
MQDNERLRTMSNVETRQVNRDSLFLLAQVRVDGQEQVSRVKGAQPLGWRHDGRGRKQGRARFARRGGLRNVGWVEGSVAWKQDNRFGIAFADEIDPTIVRGPGGPVSGQAEFEIPSYTKNHQAVPASQQELNRLRKI